MLKLDRELATIEADGTRAALRRRRRACPPARRQAAALGLTGIEFGVNIPRHASGARCG